MAWHELWIMNQTASSGLSCSLGLGFRHFDLAGRFIYGHYYCYWIIYLLHSLSTWSNLLPSYQSTTAQSGLRMERERVWDSIIG